jgi:hypothetical protein
MARCGRQDLIFGAAALAIGLAAMLLYARFFSEVIFPYSYDSASYISAARNLLEGKGLMAPTLADGDEDLQTIYLWPPGYPLLIYLFSFVLGTPYAAALFISRLSLALVPVAAYWLLRPYCTPGRALLLSLLFWTPLGLMPNAYYTGSDAPFFLLALLSTGAFLRGIDTSDVRFLAAAGALGGASLVIRNVGLFLLASQAVILIITSFDEKFDLKHMFRRAAAWGLAAAIPAGGLLIWNKVQFGTLSPYDMPPSTLSVLENIGAAMSAYAYDSFPSSASKWLAARYVLVSAPLFVLMVLLLFLGVCIRYRQNKPLGRFALLAVIYAGLGTIMVVAARTRYQWGEIISVRHIAQYDSFLIAGALVWLGQFWPVRRRGAAIAAIVLVIVGWRAWFFVQQYQSLNPVPQQNSALFLKDNRNAQNILMYYAQLPQLHDLAARISPGCHVSTNLYTVMASTLGQNAHDLDQEQFFSLDRLYMEILNDRAKNRPALIVLGQTPVKHNTSATWRQKLQGALPDFRLLTFDPASLIVLESAKGDCLRG